MSQLHRSIVGLPYLGRTEDAGSVIGEQRNRIEEELADGESELVHLFAVLGVSSAPNVEYAYYSHDRHS